MDDVTWGALTLTLTLLGATWTWFAFRRRGVASGLRGAGLTLLPAAAWLTGTMEMFTEIGGSVADWATHLVFSPVVWAGVVLAGLSVVLLGASGAMRERGIGGPKGARDAAAPKAVEAPPAGAQARAQERAQRGAPAIDDDMAEIEALLKKRGIS